MRHPGVDQARFLAAWGLLGKLSRGEFTQEEVTLIEGWTLIQMREALNKHPALRHDSRDMSAAELRQYLGITDKALEGWLFPDTYLFPKGESDLKVLARALTSYGAVGLALRLDLGDGLGLGGRFGGS